MPHRLRTLACYSLCVLIGVISLSSVIAEDDPVAKAPAGDSNATYKLAYKFQKGEVVRYETLHNVKFVSQFKGTEEVASNKTQTRKVYRVVSVNPDGSAELELVIEWVRMKADFGSGGLPVEFDSKDPAAKSQAKFADVLRNVGRPQARLQCAPSGKVTTIKEMSLVAPAAIGAQAVQLKDVAGNKDMDFLTVFPDEAISIGKSWVENSDLKVTVEDKLKETIKLQRKYTLESVTGNVATVSFQTSILTPVKNPVIAIQLIQRETKGKLEFDLDKGAMISRNVDSNKSVINPAGNNTAMHSTSYLLERMVTSTADISDLPSEKTNK